MKFDFAPTGVLDFVRMKRFALISHSLFCVCFRLVGARWWLVGGLF